MIGDGGQIVRIEGFSGVSHAHPGFRHCRVMPAAGFAHPAICDDAGAAYVMSFHMLGNAGGIRPARRFDYTLADIAMADIGD